MAILSTGNTFGATDTVTNTKLNNIANAATFDDPVDNSTLELHTDGKLRIKDGGVTKAKIENVADMKVLGNVSGSAAAPDEVSILDEDNMTSDSATSLATQQSIKAYVDDSSTDGFTPTSYVGEESVTLPNGLIMKFGKITSGIPTYGVAGTISFSSAFPTACMYATIITDNYAGNSSANNTIESVSTSQITYIHGMLSTSTIYWQAIGY